MQSPEQQYLEQVLGIRQFLRPEGRSPRTVCVLSKHEMSDGEKLLLEKMLASVQITGFSIHNNVTEDPDASGYVILGDEQISVTAPCVRIGDFEKLVLNPNSPEVRNLKKQIWEDLKHFKKNLEI
jgi:hypothetical protein